MVLNSLIQQLAHIAQKSRGKSGGSPILQIRLAFWWEQLAKFTVINPDADQSLLAFIRSVVQSYLHIDEIVPGPSFWKMKVVLHDSNQLTGHSHWPTTRETAKMCPPWLLKSSSHLL